MTTARKDRPVIPGRVLAAALLPFAIPAALALVMALGTDWPRQVAPGSGLKTAGLVATLINASIIWLWSIQKPLTAAARRFSGLFCLVTGLFAWPVWSVGVLPSVNGAFLGDQQEVTMRLDRLEATTQTRSRDLNYWAWLTPEGAEDARAGRYIIPQSTFDQWSATPPETVRLGLAVGILGARVVTGVR